MTERKNYNSHHKKLISVICQKLAQINEKTINKPTEIWAFRYSWQRKAQINFSFLRICKLKLYNFPVKYSFPVRLANILIWSEGCGRWDCQTFLIGVDTRKTTIEGSLTVSIIIINICSLSLSLILLLSALGIKLRATLPLNYIPNPFYFLSYDRVSH